MQLMCPGVFNGLCTFQRFHRSIFFDRTLQERSMLRSIPSVPAREIEACGTAMEPSTPKAKSIDCQVMGVSGPACNGAVDAPPECIARAVARSANGRGGVMFHRLSRSDHPQSRTGRPLCRAPPPIEGQSTGRVCRELCHYDVRGQCRKR